MPRQRFFRLSAGASKTEGHTRAHLHSIADFRSRLASFLIYKLATYRTHEILGKRAFGTVYRFALRLRPVHKGFVMD